MTQEQQAVVDQPLDACVLVTAGPGAGKTHTLVKRLDALVSRGLASGEILVLSFSRAAVRELRSRLARYGEAARHVRAQTFDSWALELLTEVDADRDWRSFSFESRIEKASEAIESGRADVLLDDLLHVVVDEVQDLVGARRRMVEALLERFAVGFTVVGDPAQSIYGFQIEDPEERDFETNRFFFRLREIFGDRLVELSLEKNFRVRNEAAAPASDFSGELRRAQAAPGVFGRLRGRLRGMDEFGRLDDEFAKAALDHDDVTTAILCRSNGQAMLASEDLHRAGVRHRLQRSAQDKVVPSWVGDMYRANESTFVTRQMFQEIMERRPSDPGDDVDLLWGWLIRSTSKGRNTSVVDLRVLRAIVESGRLPDELVDKQESSVVVSSYHRAKGLEFDRVMVADPGGDNRDADSAEEARALYVAMTRARDEVTWIETPGDYRVRVNKAIDRWARYAWNGRTTLGIELRGGDVSTDLPPGGEDFDSHCLPLQRHLATEIDCGDEVVLERLYDVSLVSGQSPPYLVMHRDRPIATVSRRFRRVLSTLQRSTGRRGDPWWPLRITGVRIDAVETTVGSEAAGVEAGLGPHGVWLVPRLSGLGKFYYGKHNEGPA
ncbi:UvrD-helicase domain-containing protein [Lentzea sp. NPDC003310]|uniref:UvrD-helicase domain-containing protein n=1 Tax=Lentzea sp. NPDC003310 TaxID=3154447 RepID=UPI00339FFDB7